MSRGSVEEANNVNVALARGRAMEALGDVGAADAARGRGFAPAVLHRALEQLNKGRWMDGPDDARRVFAVAALQQARLRLRRWMGVEVSDHTEATPRHCSDALKAEEERERDNAGDGNIAKADANLGRNDGADAAAEIMNIAVDGSGKDGAGEVAGSGEHLYLDRDAVGRDTGGGRIRDSRRDFPDEDANGNDLSGDVKRRCMDRFNTTYAPVWTLHVVDGCEGVGRQTGRGRYEGNGISGINSAFDGGTGNFRVLAGERAVHSREESFVGVAGDVANRSCGTGREKDEVYNEIVSTRQDIMTPEESMTRARAALQFALADTEHRLLLGTPPAGMETGILQAPSAATQAPASLQPKTECEGGDGEIGVEDVIEEKGGNQNHCNLRQRPLFRLPRPTLEDFSNNLLRPRRPAVLIDCCEKWPARWRWTKAVYLAEVAGEAGARSLPYDKDTFYTDYRDWFRSFRMLDYVVGNAVWGPGFNAQRGRLFRKLGYFPQYPFFNRIPKLLEDIHIPVYCMAGDGPDGAAKDEEPVKNAWYGVPNTVSPLRFEPKHLLLTEVLGQMKVLLYHPSASECLYRCRGISVFNTARVDPEEPDFRRFPRFMDTEALECTLNPGDMLYIPPGWWYYVRSLTVSFSVSFWWE